MALLKCNMCGGELELTTDSSVAVCQFCGLKITIPKDLEEKGTDYNRAVFLRQHNEFDKAALIYEEILKKDNTDAEAHWGLVLSKFGIEYVTNPTTGERHPTCHRTQSESILSDPDYQAALQYFDSEAAAVIEEQAREINEIQSKILEISRKESPYDIFICYKETDDDTDERTEDSTIAQELYYSLIKQGYKVFFARKTLEQKLGSEFEPVIYAALNSAKVMIVLGTRPEYFNAVWVRNEWSRFIKMARDSKDEKIIIPAYKGFSAYELPNELSIFQSQDMSKIGFLQDLTDGIERCLRHKVGADEKSPNSSAGSVDMHQRNLKNAETHIRLQNYSAAEVLYKDIVNDYPDDFKGWWGLIVCATKDFTEFNCDFNQINTWYKYVRQLATPEQVAETEKAYIPFLQKVAELDANNDTEKVIGIIAKHKQSITDNQQKISTFTKRLATFREEYRVQEKIDSQNIAKASKTLKANQGLSLRKKIFLGIFAACTLMAILLFVIAIWAEVSEILIAAFVVGFIGFISLLISPKGKFKVYASRIKRATDYLNDCYACQSRNSELHDKTVKNFENTINEANKEITLLKMKITACNNYIALGSNVIADFCFALRCAGCGIVADMNKTTKELRDLAYGYKEIVVAESKNEVNKAPQNKPEEQIPAVQYEVNCEYCGTPIAVGDKEYERGFVFCGLCGGKMEVKK